MDQTMPFEMAEHGVGVCFVIAYLVFILAILALVVVVYCRIFGKAGYPWALGLLMFVPIANIVMILILAFGDWPILKELRALKRVNQAPLVPTDPPPQG